MRSQWREAIEIVRVAPWLERYRPHVWQFVIERVGRPGGAFMLPTLIRALDDHSLEIGEMREQRADFHRDLVDDLTAVFDLLLRAEAWLGAAAERRDNWGGGRAGAGRPAKAAASFRQL
ncbi:hypothetical protein D6Z43_17325 [Pseudomonas sp. DY-1]|nr:hypothetical protein D6Z43_17325 [Pseudomonas sp. DY-1]